MEPSGGKRRGRPRKYESPVERLRAFRKAHRLRKVTVDVPDELADELRAYATLLRQRKDAAPRGFKWRGRGDKHKYIHFIGVYEQGGIEVRAGISRDARTRSVQWDCVALEEIDSQASQTLVFEAYGISDDLTLAEKLAESSTRICAAHIFEKLNKLEKPRAIS